MKSLLLVVLTLLLHCTFLSCSYTTHQQQVREMFNHAYDAYMLNVLPHSTPLTLRHSQKTNCSHFNAAVWILGASMIPAEA